jgi:hypothetical protein
LKDLFRIAIKNKEVADHSALLAEIGGVRQLVSGISSDPSSLEKLVSDIEMIVRGAQPTSDRDALVAALERALPLLDRLWDALTELRRQARLGPA